MRRAGRAAVVAVIALGARSGAARAQAQVAEAEVPGARSLAEEKWPLEAVRRPLTLPAGMMSASLSMAGFRPDLQYVDSAGNVHSFNSSVSVGFGVAFGLTDRLQASVGAPFFFCFETDFPSRCTGASRYAGAGATARVLAVRGRHLQVAPAATIDLAQTSPVLLRWCASTAMRFTAHDTALTFTPTLVRNFGTTTAQPSNPWMAYLPIGMGVQLAQRLLAYGVVEPWGAIDHVAGGIGLELYGGVAYTFGRFGEGSLAGGTYNVLDRPDWGAGLLGSFVQLAFSFWHYS